MASGLENRAIHSIGLGFNDSRYDIPLILTYDNNNNLTILYVWRKVRMRKVFLLMAAVASGGAEEEAGEATLSTRQEKVFSVFNVVSFPNSACGASSGYNGTCYTSSGEWGTAKVLIGQ